MQSRNRVAKRVSQDLNRRLSWLGCVGVLLSAKQKAAGSGGGPGTRQGRGPRPQLGGM